MTYSSRKSAALLYYGQEPPNPDDALNEAFLDGKSAAHKERAAKGTDGNKNRPELRALAAAIAAVCARRKPPLKPADSDDFAESICAEVRHEVSAAVDSKTRLRLANRKKQYPGISTIRRAIRLIPRNAEKT